MLDMISHMPVILQDVMQGILWGNLLGVMPGRLTDGPCVYRKTDEEPCTMFVAFEDRRR